MRRKTKKRGRGVQTNHGARSRRFLPFRTELISRQSDLATNVFFFLPPRIPSITLSQSESFPSFPFLLWRTCSSFFCFFSLAVESIPFRASFCHQLFLPSSSHLSSTSTWQNFLIASSDSISSLLRFLFQIKPGLFYI